jgi:hypothetical protein
MFLCFDVAGVLGGLLDLLALGFLGGELAGHDVWVWMECFDFYLWEEDLRDMMKMYFSGAKVSQDAGTFHYLYPVVLVVMVSESGV